MFVEDGSQEPNGGSKRGPRAAANVDFSRLYKSVEPALKNLLPTLDRHSSRDPLVKAALQEIKTSPEITQSLYEFAAVAMADRFVKARADKIAPGLDQLKIWSVPELQDMLDQSLNESGDAKITPFAKMQSIDWLERGLRKSKHVHDAQSAIIVEQKLFIALRPYLEAGMDTGEAMIAVREDLQAS